jgi:hypothetical protein
MFSIGVLFWRYNGIFRSKDLTFVHILGGEFFSQLFSNKEMIGVLTNRKSSLISGDINHQSEKSFEVCYIIMVAFVFWSSAKAKI